MISSVFMVTSPWVRAQMGDDARSSADLLSRGRRDYRHHLPVELEFYFSVRQQTGPRANFRRNSDLTLRGDAHGFRHSLLLPVRVTPARRRASFDLDAALADHQVERTPQCEPCGRLKRSARLSKTQSEIID